MSGVKNRTYNADNQLVNPGFVYDGNGSPTTYNAKLLGYDPEQRMTSFGPTQTDAYNGDGLRTWKQKGALSTRTYYLYDGSVPVCEFSSTGALTATNTFAGGGLVSRRVGSTTTYYAFDERGNVAQRISAAGAVTTSDLYDGYGARTSTVAVQPDPFGYGGEFGYFTDVETGLVLCTHRYYDPAAGRFVTRDPIGYAGGVNLYGYTGNNPGNETDPSGLMPPLALAGGGTLTGGTIVSAGGTTVAAIFWPVAAVAAAGAFGYTLGTAATALGNHIANGIHAQEGLPASISYSTGAKSREEYEHHEEKLKIALEQEQELLEKLGRVKGPKARAPIEKELENLRNGRNGIRGHQKEIAQKWPNGCPVK